MINRLLGFTMALCVSISCVGGLGTAFAEEEEFNGKWAIFSNPIEADGITVWTGDAGSANYGKIADGDAEKTVMYLGDKEKGEATYAYIQLDSRYCAADKNRVIITIEYFDQEEVDASWSLAYDSVNAAWNYQDSIKCTGAGTWKKQTFEFTDAHFKRRCNGADMRIGATGSIALHKITVERIDSIVIDAKAAKMANQFFVNDTVLFDLNLINEKDSEETLEVSYKAVNPHNFIVYEGAFTQRVGARGKIARKLDLGILPRGAYHLVINASNADKSIKNNERYRFGVINDLSQRDFTITNFGACVHFAQGKGKMDVLKNIMKQAGMVTLRDEYYWNSIEREKGKYQWDYDWYINDLTEAGYEMTIVLSYGNTLYGGRLPLDDEYRKAFAKYGVELAKRLRGKVKYFEVWNEWNGGGGSSAENYYLLLKETYEAIKAEVPEAFIIGCGAVGYDYSFLTKVLDLGGWQYMDAISYHYPNRLKFNELAHRITDYAFENYGKKLEAWVTEIGWANEHADKGGTPEVLSAGYSAQLYLENHTDPTAHGKIHYYEFLNSGSNPAEHEHNFGVVALEADGAPKPIFVSMNAAADLLNGTTYAETYETGIEGMHMRRFEGKGGDIVALWLDDGEIPVSIDMGKNSYRVIDGFGNEIPYEAVNNSINVTASALPLYFAGNFRTAPTIGESSYQIHAENINVVPGDEFLVEIHRSKGAENLSGRYRISVPDGWNVVSGNTFKAGSTKDEILLRVGESYTAPTGRIEVSAISSSGRRLSNLGLDTRTVDVFVAEFRPMLNEEKDGYTLQAKLVNNYATATIPKGSLTVVEPKEAEGVYEFDEIAPKGVKYIEIPAPMINKNQTTQYTMNLRTDDGVSRNIIRSVSSLTVPRAPANMVIDGNVSETQWANAMRVYAGGPQTKNYKPDKPWRGMDDLSGVGMFMWDDDYLYFATEITDDVHIMEEADWLWAWQADSLQYSIDPGRAYGYAALGGHRFIASVNSLTGEGNNSVEATDMVDGGGDPLANQMFAAKRDEANKKTKFEMALKWSDIVPPRMLPVKANDTCIGFSWMYNDNDASQRSGWIEYMSGIGAGKLPALFGDLILSDETVLDKLPVDDISDMGELKPVDPADLYPEKAEEVGGFDFVPQAKMKIIDATPHESEHVAANILNNNKRTRYQIRQGSSLPHFITVDLGGVYEIDAIDYYTQDGYNGGSIFTYDVYMGDDLENLQLVTEGAKAPDYIIGSTQHTIGQYRLEFPDGKRGKGRYLKLVITDSKYGDLRISNFNLRYLWAQPSLSVMLNNRQIEFDSQPIIDNGRTLVPLRAIFEAMGAEVQWDDATQTVTAIKGDTEIKLGINDTNAYKNGSTIELDVPAKLEEGRTFVPVRFIGESFDAEVAWDEKNQIVSITMD